MAKKAEKSFLIHSGKGVKKLLDEYGKWYYFATITTPSGTHVFISKTPKAGFYSQDKIQQAIYRGDFD